MKVLIPAAGLGTRLRPHTHHRPKPLMHVAGNTVLGHVLDRLRGLDIEEMIFIVGHLGDQLRKYVAAHYDFKARFVVQEELLGQAHAIMLAREWIGGPLFILFVDTIFEADLAGLEESGADGVIYVHPVEDPSRFGVVTVDERGCVKKFVEKPAEPISNLAIVGLYFLQDGQALLRAIDQLIEGGRKTKGEYYLADALQLLVDQGACILTRPVSVWEDCGTRPALLRTNRYLLQQMEPGQAPAADEAVIVPPVWVASDAVLERSIVGPYAWVGAGCRIEGSIVGPFVSLDEGVQVTNSQLGDTIVEREAHIADASLTASLVGASAQVHGGREQLNVGDHTEIDLGRPATGKAVPDRLA